MPELVSTEVTSVPAGKEDMASWSEEELRDHYEDLKRLNEGLHETSVVTGNPYTILPGDEDIFVNTNSESITVLLPVGLNGKQYRIINTGTSSNDVTVTPDGSELLTGESNSRTLSDRGVIILTYNTTEGWW